MRADFKFLLIFLSLAQGILAVDWNYKKQGADWTDALGGPCKSGEAQSPIDLKAPEFDKNLKGNAMVFKNYDKSLLKSSLENNGRTIELSPSPSQVNPPKISGGGLDGTYEFAQFHFHWGNSENKGSEHQMDGKAFPMEAHLVHFNTKYRTFATALSKPDGLAVLGFFYEIDEDGKDYEMFKKLNNPLKKITTTRRTKPTIQSFNLKDFLPENPEKEDFYRYNGSLTTPGCNQVVTWTVFKDPLKLPQELMDEFRKQKIDQTTNLVNNFRNVQPLNGRKILANFESNTESTGGSSSPKVFWAMLGINTIALTFLIGW